MRVELVGIRTNMLFCESYVLHVNLQLQAELKPDPVRRPFSFKLHATDQVTPNAVVAHIRIFAGGAGQPTFLPRPF